MTNVKFLSDDDNGNKWYEVNGSTYGVTTDGRIMDKDGIPFPSDDQHGNQVADLINESA